LIYSRSTSQVNSLFSSIDLIIAAYGLSQLITGIWQYRKASKAEKEQ